MSWDICDVKTITLDTFMNGMQFLRLISYGLMSKVLKGNDLGGRAALAITKFLYTEYVRKIYNNQTLLPELIRMLSPVFTVTRRFPCIFFCKIV